MTKNQNQENKLKEEQIIRNIVNLITTNTLPLKLKNIVERVLSMPDKNVATVLKGSSLDKKVTPQIFKKAKLTYDFLEHCRSQNLDGIRQSLKNGADINFSSQKNIPELFLFIGYELKKTIKCLIEEKIDLKRQNNQGMNCLYAACQLGNLEIVKILIEASERQEIDLYTQGNPEISPIVIAQAQKHKELFDYLSQKYEKPKEKPDIQLRLIKLCIDGDLKQLELLFQEEVLIKQISLDKIHEKMTPLEYSYFAFDESKAESEEQDGFQSLRKDSKIAEFLINKGANLSVNNVGQVLLAHACRHNEISLIELLLKKGMKPAEILKDEGLNANMMAYRYGNLETVKIISEHQSDINSKSEINGYTPLIEAINNNNIAIIQYLVNKKDADVNAPSTDGLLPIMAAYIWNRDDVFDFLLQNKKIVINEPTKIPSILFYAMGRGDVHTFEKLLKHNPNTLLNQRFGLTPLAFALSLGEVEIVNSLLDHGLQKGYGSIGLNSDTCNKAILGMAIRYAYFNNDYSLPKRILEIPTITSTSDTLNYLNAFPDLLSFYEEILKERENLENKTKKVNSLQTKPQEVDKSQVVKNIDSQKEVKIEDKPQASPLNAIATGIGKVDRGASKRADFIREVEKKLSTIVNYVRIVGSDDVSQTLTLQEENKIKSSSGYNGYAAYTKELKDALNKPENQTIKRPFFELLHNPLFAISGQDKNGIKRNGQRFEMKILGKGGEKSQRLAGSEIEIKKVDGTICKLIIFSKLVPHDKAFTTNLASYRQTDTAELPLEKGRMH